MNTFIISKILCIFFGTTTVVLFWLSYTGLLIERVGSFKIAFILYLMNFALLLGSLLFYIWQKGRRNVTNREDDVLREAPRRV